MRSLRIASTVVVSLAVLFWACEQNTTPVEPGDLSLGTAAGGGAHKAPMYDALDNSQTGYTCAGGVDLNNLENDGTFGFAVMNTVEGNVVGEVSLKNGEPATYDVYLHQYPVNGRCSPSLVATIVTNAQGNGNAHITWPRTDGATHFWVSLVDQASSERYRTTSVQLD
jgi:hypothetical protein